MQKPLAHAVPTRTSLAPATGAIAVRDLVTLAKPRITLMVVITAAGGLFLTGRAGQTAGTGASVHLSTATVLATLIGTSLIVSGANALNMYMEREIDKRMDRTKNRPLPAGRL